MTTSLISYENPPRPRELGLHYDEWREGQWEAVVDIRNEFTDNDIVFLIADTGAGKSGIGMATASYYTNASMLTKTISLEEQYGNAAGIEIGRGRSHWPCGRGRNALECWEDEECGAFSGGCEYREHRARMAGQSIRVLNYAQFYAWNSKGSAFRTDLVVCDEAHGLEGTIQGFAQMWYKLNKMPTWGREYSQQLLFNHGRKFLLMSASMIPQLIAETVGIEKYAVIEVDNHFPAESNPIWCKPVGYITYNRPYTDRIVRFIDNHLSNTSLNGVVHTASDRETQEILNATRYPDRFIWPKGTTRGAQFQEFKDSAIQGGGRVLISASASEGQDFPDDQCRWQVITKVPYASLADETTRERREQRPDIYRLEALQRIQQDCGRGMRHKDDWCVNYILDATAIGLYDKYHWVMSKRFNESWKGKEG